MLLAILNVKLSCVIFMMLQRLRLVFLTVLVGTIASPVLAAPFDPPPNNDAPSSTAGGGSRPAASFCTLDESSGLRATALAPQTFVGLTTQSSPHLWLYLPTNEVDNIEFTVFDQDLNDLSQIVIPAPDSPGFLAIDASDHMALSTGTPHYWTAAFICNPNRRTEDWVVGGWIQYEPLSASHQHALQALAPMEQVRQQISNGYWYDALTVMQQLVEAEPSSLALATTWDTLISQADLPLAWTEVEHLIHRHKQISVFAELK